MYLRLVFWTMSIAYTALLFAHFGATVYRNGQASPGVLLTAVFLGGLMGFALGGLFVNRRTRSQD